MDNLFMFLFLLSLVAIIIVLIKPKWLGFNSRKKALAVTVGSAVIFFIGFGITSPTGLMSRNRTG